MTEIGKVYSETNYDLFHFMKNNRQIKRSNVEAKKKSILKHGQLVPLLMERDREIGKLYIAEGQHRFTALKELGLPIMFIIREKLKSDGRPLSALASGTNRNLTPEDWADVYQDRPAYAYLRAVSKKTGLPPTQVHTLIFGTEIKASFKEGIFQVTDLDKVNFEQRHQELHEFLRTLDENQRKDFVNRGRNVLAFTLLRKFPNYAHKHLLVAGRNSTGWRFDQSRKKLVCLENLIKFYNERSGARLATV